MTVPADQAGERPPITPEQARKRIRLSWIFAAGGLLWLPFSYAVEPSLRQALQPTFQEEARPWALFLAIMPIGAYAFWALFWGLLGLGKYWKRHVRKIGFFSVRLELLRQRIPKELSVWRGFFGALVVLPVLALEIGFYFAVLFGASYVYGLFGGGIYQYRRHRKLMRAVASPLA